MKKNRFSTEQTIGFIKQAEAGWRYGIVPTPRLQPGQLLPVASASRLHGSPSTTIRGKTTTQQPSTLDFISSHWYGQWGQINLTTSNSTYHFFRSNPIAA